MCVCKRMCACVCVMRGVIIRPQCSGGTESSEQVSMATPFWVWLPVECLGWSWGYMDALSLCMFVYVSLLCQCVMLFNLLSHQRLRRDVWCIFGSLRWNKLFGRNDDLHEMMIYLSIHPSSHSFIFIYCIIYLILTRAAFVWLKIQ